MNKQHRSIIVIDIDIDNYQDGATIEKLTEYYKELIQEHFKQDTTAKVLKSQGQLQPRRAKRTANISNLVFRGSRGKNTNLSWVQKERRIRDKLNVDHNNFYK